MGCLEGGDVRCNVGEADEGVVELEGLGEIPCDAAAGEASGIEAASWGWLG